VDRCDALALCRRERGQAARGIGAILRQLLADLGDALGPDLGWLAGLDRHVTLDVGLGERRGSACG
jgi:hypothetical protein